MDTHNNQPHPQPQPKLLQESVPLPIPPKTSAKAAPPRALALVKPLKK